MGGGAEKKKTNQMIDEQNKWARSGANAYNAIAQPQQQQAVTAANNIQQSAYDNLNRVGQGAGWIDPNMRSEYLKSLGVGGDSGGGGGAASPSRYGGVKGLYTEFSGKGGGVDAAPIRQAMGAMREISGTGGWSQADRDAQYKNIAGFEDMARNGGLNDEAMFNMRGGGVFSDFQKTGGYTDAQLGDIRTRANSTLPAFYDTVRQNTNRMGSIQGGNPQAAAAMAARTARDEAKGMREQTLDTELGLSDRVREGKQWGAEGGAQAEGALQSLRTGNMLSGLRGATDARGNMLNSIASNRTAASQGWTGGELGIADLIQKGRQFGTSGLKGVADSEQAAANAAASRSAASNADRTRGLQWLANFESGNTMDSAGGMIDLYQAVPGEVNMWNNALLANRGQQMNDTNSQVDRRMQNNPQRDWASTIGGLVGAAGGAMTGLGALGMGAKAVGGGGTGAAGRAPSPYGYG